MCPRPLPLSKRCSSTSKRKTASFLQLGLLNQTQKCHLPCRISISEPHSLSSSPLLLSLMHTTALILNRCDSLFDYTARCFGPSRGYCSRVSPAPVCFRAPSLLARGRACGSKNARFSHSLPIVPPKPPKGMHGSQGLVVWGSKTSQRRAAGGRALSQGLCVYVCECGRPDITDRSRRG